MYLKDKELFRDFRKLQIVVEFYNLVKQKLNLKRSLKKARFY